MEVFHCASCHRPLSRPVRAVPDQRLLAAPGRVTRTPPATWTSGPEAGDVCIHPHDLVVGNVEPTAFGCCGYAPRGNEANLLCACGAPVGVFSDECSVDFELTLRRPRVVVEPEEAWDFSPERLDAALSGIADDAAVSEDTRWGVDDGAATAARDLRISIDRQAGGIAVTFRIDATPVVVAMPRLVLARAIAFAALPVGNAELVVCSCRSAPRGNAILEEFELVASGDRVLLHHEAGPVRQRYEVMGEWLALEWRDAVERLARAT